MPNGFSEKASQQALLALIDYNRRSQQTLLAIGPNGLQEAS